MNEEHSPKIFARCWGVSESDGPIMDYFTLPKGVAELATVLEEVLRKKANGTETSVT
jgi:hypothetical protein